MSIYFSGVEIPQKYQSDSQIQTAIESFYNSAQNQFESFGNYQNFLKLQTTIPNQISTRVSELQKLDAPPIKNPDELQKEAASMVTPTKPSGKISPLVIGLGLVVFYLLIR